MKHQKPYKKKNGCKKCKSEKYIYFQVIKGILMRVCLDCGWANELGRGFGGYGIALSQKQLDYINAIVV